MPTNCLPHQEHSCATLARGARLLCVLRTGLIQVAGPAQRVLWVRASTVQRLVSESPSWGGWRPRRRRGLGARRRPTVTRGAPRRHSLTPAAPDAWAHLSAEACAARGVPCALRAARPASPRHPFESGGRGAVNIWCVRRDVRRRPYLGESHGSLQWRGRSRAARSTPSRPRLAFTVPTPRPRIALISSPLSRVRPLALRHRPSLVGPLCRRAAAAALYRLALRPAALSSPWHKGLACLERQP
jgi:hypothetical protein